MRSVIKRELERIQVGFLEIVFIYDSKAYVDENLSGPPKICCHPSQLVLPTACPAF